LKVVDHVADRNAPPLSLPRRTAVLLSPNARVLWREHARAGNMRSCRVLCSESNCLLRNADLVRSVEVRYAVRDGHSLAFEVFGDGPCDVVLTQSACPIDLLWDLPQLASFLETLGGFARVIASDPRGQGASDPILDPGAAAAETQCDDLLAVLDAADSQRATILSMSGGSYVVLFAATYPERVRSLITVHLRLSYPEFRGLSAERRTKLARALVTTQSLRAENPRVAHDPVLQQWWGRARRLLNSPEATARGLEFAAHIEMDSVASAVRVPTLVLHRRDNHLWDIETSRAAASRIPGARFVEVPGSETDIFLGDTTPVLTEIERFLREKHPDLADDRPLATVLFTDIVASTEQLATVGDNAWRHILDDHDDAVDRAVAAHRGRVIKKMGDGMLATFDGPARAVHCAEAIRDTFAERGIAVRAGLHTGEIEIRNDDVAGIAVHIASRVAALAGPGEILASRTVVDLTAGSGIAFDPRGDHQLKGVPGHWPIFAAC
jgi:class 3 adenylate cyclase